MEFMPVIKFKVNRIENQFLPIIQITGVTREMLGIKNVLILKAVEIIEKFQKYEGRLMEIKDNEKIEEIQKGVIGIRFYIIFKNEQQLLNTISSIKEELE